MTKFNVDDVLRPVTRRPLRRLPLLTARSIMLMWSAARRPFLLSASLQALAGLAIAAQVLVGRHLLHLVLSNDPSFAAIAPALTVFVIVTALVAFAGVGRTEQQRLLSELVASHATDKVLEVATSAPLIAYETPGFHDRLERAKTNAVIRPMHVANGVIGLCSAGFAVAGIGAALFVMQPVFLTLVAIGYVPSWLASVVAGKAMHDYATAQTERDRRRMYLLMTLTGKQEAQEVRAFNLGGFLRGAPDIDVRWQSSGPVPAEPPPGEPLLRLELQGAMRYAAAFDGRVHRLRFAGCCEFTVHADLRAVGCRPDPSVDPELVSILAAGALTSFVLTVAGTTILHASAVQIGDAAVGFIGASGFGKSTVAALMCAGGCELVADDVLRVEFADQVLVHAGATELRLRSTVREIVDCFPDRVPTRHTADGRIAVCPPPTARTLLPLAALAIPRPVAADDDLRVHRLSKVDALVRLLAFPRLLGWTSEDFLRQQFEGLADLVERVPVLEVQVPSGPPFDAEMGRRLRDALWADVPSEPG